MLTAEAEAALLQDGWRGNIRQLRHVVKGAALRAAGGAIAPVHLDLDRGSARSAAVASVAVNGVEVAASPSAAAAPAAAGGTWKDRLEAQEKEALQKTLAEAGGNLTRAAELFGVPRTTYRERLIRHGLLEA
jgi:DNA-binding NtrC family response regulator